MDELDKAEAQQEELLRRAIDYARRCKVDRPYTGECYNCQEPLDQPHRYCDADCRDDYEKRRERGQHTRG